MMSAITAPLERNRILACLPTKERKVLNEHLDLVSLRTKEELHELGSPVRHLHFPINCAISLMDFKRGGGIVEVAVVGNEGCTGSTALQGNRNALCRVLVQVGGSALRLSVPAIVKALPNLPFLQYALSRFTTTLLRASIVSVGCSQFHSVEQRIGRWLLAHQHRIGVSVFPFTHDFLAEQLGVQRVTVSEALASLQERKIIRYGYRQVELRNSRAMEKLSCECFPTVKDAIDDFLQDITTYPSPRADA
jgi:hypothetical protein